MAATLVATIADSEVTFTVTGATGPLRVRWGDATDDSLPAAGGSHVYGDGEFHAIVVDGGTGQRIEQDVMVPAPGVPTIDSLSSAALPAGPPSNTDLHIFGSGFGRCSQIRFGSVLEEDWSHTENHFRSSHEVVLEITGGRFPGENPDVPVSVLTPVPGGGESAPASLAFTEGIGAALSVTLVAPATVLRLVPTAVTIKGTGFTDAADVVFIRDGAGTEFACTDLVVVDDTTITCTTGALAGSAATGAVYSVRVDDSGESALLAAAVQLSVTTITGCTPNVIPSAAVPTALTLTGTNMGNFQPTEVHIGATSAAYQATDVVAVSDTEVTCVSAAGVAQGAVSITLVNAHGVSAAASGLLAVSGP